MGNPSRLKSRLQNLDAESFEELVAEVWSAMGWSTDVSQSSRDKGVDVIGEKTRIYTEKAVIQAKCYSDGTRVGRPDIQQYNTLKRQISGADTVIVVTSSSFTSEATSLAEQLNVKTVNGEELAQASLEYLSEERLEALLCQQTSEAQSDSPRGTESTEDSISTDSLSYSENDLAKIYRGYYERYTEDAEQRVNRDRRIIFQLYRDEQFDKRVYILRDRTHYIYFEPESREVLQRFAATADKYGWEIKNLGAEPDASPGTNWVHKSPAFSIAVDTAASATADPERQAKITGQMFSYVLNQELSGTKIKEVTGTGTGSAAGTEIK